MLYCQFHLYIDVVSIISVHTHTTLSHRFNLYQESKSGSFLGSSQQVILKENHYI